MLFQKSNNDHLSRKEREKLYKRMEILSAAVPLFAEKGYENTTIDDIAEKAEFGKGTIYNYFQGKEDIYWGILEEIFQSYSESLQQIDKECDKLYDFMKKLTRELFDFCLNNQHAFIMITRLRTGLPNQASNSSQAFIDYQQNVDKIFTRRINKAIKAGEINSIDPGVLFTLYRSMVFPYIYNQMFCNKNVNIDIVEQSDLVVNILFNGIKK